MMTINYCPGDGYYEHRITIIIIIVIIEIVLEAHILIHMKKRKNVLSYKCHFMAWFPSAVLSFIIVLLLI